ncbi:microtubule associated protein (MAP65/ASE1 family) domain-containing protein [Ditylenchus destructor]|nr:microtubule associated protein (MAP65/ASE1 family) domain-containing protein [Ditylenchus destructor]
MDPTQTAEQDTIYSDADTAKVTKHLFNTLADCAHLWDRVKLDKESQRALVNKILKRIDIVLDDIVSAEEKMVEKVPKDINSRRNDLLKIRSEFKQSPFDESRFPTESLILLKALEADLSHWRARKEAIMQRQQQLYNKLKELCYRADLVPTEMNGIYDTMIDSKELIHLETMVNDAKETLNLRLETLQELHQESMRIHKTLGENSKLSTDEVQLLGLDIHSPSTVITADLVTQFMALNEKLKDLHDEWVESVAIRYDELMSKMDELSQKCNVSDLPNFPNEFDPAKIDDSHMKQLKEEVIMLEDKYRRGRNVYDKLYEWTSLWKQKLNAEQKACRASFYNNRGGSIVNTLKRQKAIDVKLPKILEELKQVVTEHISSGADVADILVEDMRPDAYVQFVVDEYQKDKEMQRMQKQLSKRNETGQLKRATPMKIQKKGNNILTINSTNSQESSVPKRKRSLSCSELQISAISPVRRKNPGPKASSPKLHPQPSSSMRSTRTPSKSSTRQLYPSNTSNIVTRSAKKDQLGQQDVKGSEKRPWY